MTKVSDMQRIGHLKATVSQSERSAINRAVILWQALHRVGHDLNPTTLGEALTAICTEWMEDKVEEIGKVD